MRPGILVSLLLAVLLVSGCVQNRTTNPLPASVNVDPVEQEPVRTSPPGLHLAHIRMPAEFYTLHRRVMSFLDESLFSRAAEIDGYWYGGRDTVTRWYMQNDLSGSLGVMLDRVNYGGKANGPRPLSSINISWGEDLPQDFIPVIRDSVQEITAYTGTEVHFNGDGPGITFRMRPLRSISALRGPATPCLTSTRSQWGMLLSAEILLPLETPSQARNCILHELLHAFGVTGHSHSMVSAISYAHRTRTLSPWDKLLLKMLYTGSVPGMPRDFAINLFSHSLAGVFLKNRPLELNEAPLGPAFTIRRPDSIGLAMSAEGILPEPLVIFQGKFDRKPYSTMRRTLYRPEGPGLMDGTVDLLWSQSPLNEEESLFFGLGQYGDIPRLSSPGASTGLEKYEPKGDGITFWLVRAAEDSCIMFETADRQGTHFSNGKPGTSHYRLAGNLCRAASNPITEAEARSIIDRLATALTKPPAAGSQAGTS